MLSHDTPQRCDMVDLYYALYGTRRPFCLAQQELSFLKPERVVSPAFDRSYRDNDLDHGHDLGPDHDLDWERERIREKDRLERERERMDREREKEREREREREREKEREREREKEREKKREKERAAEKEQNPLEFGVDVRFISLNLTLQCVL